MMNLMHTLGVPIVPIRGRGVTPRGITLSGRRGKVKKGGEWHREEEGGKQRYG